MTLRALHRTSALLVVLFVCFHIINHLVSLAGVESHIEFMRALRVVYGEPLVESLLLACVAFQVASGLALVVRGWRARRGALAWLQAGSGAVLALFLIVHVGSVLYGRVALNLDTNFYYAAAGLHVPPYQLFFAPYYFFAVLAFFTHLGCAAHRALRASAHRYRLAAVVLPGVTGVIISLLIVLSLAGKLEQAEVPAKYKATFERPGA